MPTIDESKNSYTSVYADNENDKGLQKTGLELIKGQPGKQIRIDTIALRIGIVDTGITATATVMLVKGGMEIPLAVFTGDSTTYQLKSKSVSYTAGNGEDVVTKWYLKSSVFGKKAKFRTPSITYTVLDAKPSDPVDPDPTDPDPEQPDDPITPPDDPFTAEVSLIISCKSEQEAESVLEKIKPFTRTVDVYLRKKAGK